jgi:hypothetical protein
MGLVLISGLSKRGGFGGDAYGDIIMKLMFIFGNNFS